MNIPNEGKIFDFGILYFDLIAFYIAYFIIFLMMGSMILGLVINPRNFSNLIGIFLFCLLLFIVIRFIFKYNYNNLFMEYKIYKDRIIMKNNVFNLKEEKILIYCDIQKVTKLRKSPGRLLSTKFSILTNSDEIIIWIPNNVLQELVSLKVINKKFL